MKTATQYFAVVPAAGSGSRFGAQVPKQYSLLRGKPVLRHTLERLHETPWLSRIVLVVAAEDELLDTLYLNDLPKVVTTIGGSQRASSVLNGLWALDGAGERDWVLVHDAVRPCLHRDDLAMLKSALDCHDDTAGILAMPLRETLKSVDDRGLISATVDRSSLWQAATPQQCRYGFLRDALEATLGDPSITDEASALEKSGVPVRVVQGRPDNIKITWPQDLGLAAAILDSQAKEVR